MFFEQEAQHYKNRTESEKRRFEDIKTVNIDTFNRMSKLLKF